MSYENCKQCGFFPNECQCAIIRGQSPADRIASAPRAWARVMEDGGLHVVGLESFTREQAKSFADGYGIKLVRVALVTIPEDGAAPSESPKEPG